MDEIIQSPSQAPTPINEEESFLEKNKMKIIGGLIVFVIVTIGIGIALSLGNTSKLEGMLNKRLLEEQSATTIQTETPKMVEAPIDSTSAFDPAATPDKSAATPAITESPVEPSAPQAPTIAPAL